MGSISFIKKKEKEKEKVSINLVGLDAANVSLATMRADTERTRNFSLRWMHEKKRKELDS